MRVISRTVLILGIFAASNAQAQDQTPVEVNSPTNVDRAAAPTGDAAVPLISNAVIAPQQAEQPRALIIGQPQSKLSQGTEFSVRLIRELTTKDKALNVGDRFDLETVDPIKLGNVTVFPSGTRVVGEITFVRNKGMWGKSGKLQARLLFLRFGDRTFRVTGQFDDKGAGGGWGAGLTSAFVFLPAGFVMTGKSAVVPAGAIIRASLDEDVHVAVAPAAQQTATLPITVSE